MFLKNLDMLLKEHKISKNKLAKESGIPYTTIDGWYKKGCNNIGLSSLQKLSAYFDISIDSLTGNIDYGHFPLAALEERIIEKYRAIDERGKENINLILDAEYSRSQSRITDYPTYIPQSMLIVAEKTED